MIRFCKNCGSSLDSSGSCPKCSGKTAKAKGKPPEKSDDKEKVKLIPRKDGKMNRLYLWSLVGLITCCVLTITLSILVFFNVLNIPFINDMFISMNMKDNMVEEVPINVEEETNEDEEAETDEKDVINDEDNSEKYKVTPPNADEYYSNNSNVKSSLNAKESKNVSSESDVSDNLEERGFDDIDIITNYSMDGEYTDDVEISSYSGEKHPMYQAYYITESGDVWVIVEINGDVMAQPLSYNEQSGKSVPVIISEKDTMTCYDSTLNKFYVIVPGSELAILKKVDAINAETLEKLTNGEIDKL